jgi:hypothetical protein
MLKEVGDLKVNRGQESNSRGENAAVGTDLALCDEFPFRAPFSVQRSVQEARVNKIWQGLFRR